MCWTSLRYKTLACLGIGGLLLCAACSSPSPLLPGDGVATALPPAVQPTSPPKAQVEQIELVALDTFPVQVHVLTKGHLPDGCTEIDRVTTGGDLSSKWLWVEITIKKTPRVLCATEPVPFIENVPLNTRGLPAGTYTVEVNGVTDHFMLEVDNVPQGVSSTAQDVVQVDMADAGLLITIPAGWQRVEANVPFFNGAPLGNGAWSPDGGVSRIGLRWMDITTGWTPELLLEGDIEVVGRQSLDLRWAGAVVYDVLAFNPDSVQRHIIVPYRDVIAYDFYAIAVDEAVLQSLMAAQDDMAYSAILHGTPGAGSAIIRGVVWKDTCDIVEGQPPSEGCVVTDEGGYRADGQFNSQEARLPGILVELWSGACPGSDLLATTISNEAGEYRFEALSTGTYCVWVDAQAEANATILGAGRWTYPALDISDITVTLRDIHAEVYAYFGWDGE